MRKLTYLTCLCLFVLVITVGSANAAQRNGDSGNETHTNLGRASYANYVASNRSIKSMPLLSRPDRPGHFIGNSIRRAYRRRGGR